MYTRRVHMSKHDEVILALKHTRHDWLNVMQLIKGNLALGHYERIDEIIQQMTTKSIAESKLYNACAPELTLFLISYNWTSQKLNLSYELEGEEFSIAEWDQPLVSVIRSITDRLAHSSSYSIENSLMISFVFSEDDCMLFCEYVGKTHLKAADWDDLILSAAKVGIKIELVLATEYECILSILINKTS